MGFSSGLRFLCGVQLGFKVSLWGSVWVGGFSVGFSSGLRFLCGVQLRCDVSLWGSAWV